MEEKKTELPRDCVLIGIGHDAHSERMTTGEVRMATRQSVVLRFLADGAVLINGAMLGSDASLCAAVRSLFQAVDQVDPAVAALFLGGVTREQKREWEEFWQKSEIEDAICIGPLALPVESGDIVLRNRRGQVLRVRRDGAASSEAGALRLDQVVGHLRSMFTPTPRVAEHS